MRKLLYLTLTLLCFVAVFSYCTGASNNSDTNEQLSANETYTCPMHNEVMSRTPGTCPKCNMDLVKQKMTPDQEKMMKEGTFVKPEK